MELLHVYVRNARATMPPKTRFLSEITYGQIRDRARRDGAAVLQAMDLNLPEGLMVSNINEMALRSCQKWTGRQVAWDWSYTLRQYRKNPKRFELAIWVGEHLCGLALGAPSGSDLHCSVVYLESDPADTHPLHGLVFLIALTHLETYARLLNKRQTRLVSPVDQRIVALAGDLGYNFVRAPKGESDYCVKELRDAEDRETGEPRDPR